MAGQAKIDVKQAREYMKAKVEPIVGKLVQELAVEQPEQVLEFILNFAARELEATDGEEEKAKDIEEEKSNAGVVPADLQVVGEEEEQEEEEFEAQERNNAESKHAHETAREASAPPAHEETKQSDGSDPQDESDRVSEEAKTAEALQPHGEEKHEDEAELEAGVESTRNAAPICCVSGTPAELKVRLPGSDKTEFYARDIFEAMKRKNKLRGALAVELDEDFPDADTGDAPLWEYDAETLERIAAAKTVDDVDARPVTPPNRGFKMTRPGENYHDESRRDGPVNVGPVKFEARALGTISGDGGNSGDMRGAAREAAEKREKELEKNSRLTEDQRAALKLKRKKDDLIGKIRAHYATLGGAEPIGMAASSVETLQRHLSKIKAHTAAAQVDRDERSRDREKEEKLRARMLGGTNSSGGLVTSATKQKPSRALHFAPRALGSAAQNQAEQAGAVVAKEANSESSPEAGIADDPESRRRRAAEAAARRFKLVK